MTCASAMLLVSMLALLALMIVARTKASRKDIAELRHEIDNVRPLAPLMTSAAATTTPRPTTGHASPSPNSSLANNATVVNTSRPNRSGRSHHGLGRATLSVLLQRGGNDRHNAAALGSVVDAVCVAQLSEG
ncbi:MAG: hypothetical protein ACRDSE_24195, partial [Pseudonocardiaceae bacterium]